MDNKQVTECIREFTLRQQYPSIAPKQKNTNLPKVKVETKPCSQSLIPTKTKLMSTVNVQIKDGFHKLRLKSPSGKYLGEFNAQMLSYNSNIIKSKTLINQNKCKSLNKSVILSNVMSEDKAKKLVTIVPLQSIKNIINVSKLENTISSEKNNGNVNKKCQAKTISLKHIVTTDKCQKKKENTNTINMDIDIITNNECNKNGESEYNQIQNTLVKNENKLKSTKDVLLDTNVLENIKQIKNTNSLSELSEYILFPKHKNVIDTFSSTFSNQSVNMPNNIIKIVDKKSTDIGNSVLDNNKLFNNTKKELYLLPMNNEDIDISFEQNNKVINLKSDDHILSEESVNTTSNERTATNISNHQQNMFEQNMIVHNNEISLSDNCITRNDNVTHVNHNNDNVCNNSSLKYDNNNIPVATAENGYTNFKSQNVNNYSIKSHFDNDISLQQPLFSNWNTLKEIVTIKDEQIRIKAFKALVDCIAINEQIPSHLSTDLKTMCDIKVQTDINSFEPQNFTTTEENTFGIPKIKLKESYPANTIENSNINLVNDMYENSFFSLSNQSEESNIYLEKFTDDVCNKNSGANKVKQILSQANPFYNKIFKQLQKDFETAKQWDENGMLNIHRAVINNRVYDAQRHLMVLEACNINVDIPTESHMTSLELAVKHNVSTEIVKLLLKAGANPVSLKPVHESALIIASKTNFSLLPELVKHVSCTKLLNNVDFTGFAPLHYCAQYGNLKGVISLINMGANINLKESRSGRTPLFLAIENKHPIIAKKLIENGASINIPNFAGQTVISLAD